jgi:fumarylacetoacetase
MKSPDPLDATHDAGLRSCIDSANGHGEFPIQNLPLGVFSPGDGAARGGVAIGDDIVDLPALAAAGFLDAAAAHAARSTAGLAPMSSQSAEALTDELRTASLDALLALPSSARAALRAQLSRLLAYDSVRRTELLAGRGRWLHSARDCRLHRPTRVRNFTDCMASLHHVARAGRQLRPDNPVLPNLWYVPAAYHSRASSVQVSGVDVRRPCGQIPVSGGVPRFGPTQALDYEAEIALWIGGENPLGTPVPIADAGARIAGVGLLNDWSAREIQRWETQPLGPLLGKSFHTTVSPWIVTSQALQPYRTSLAPRAEGEPLPLPHLFDEQDQRLGGWLIEIEAWLHTPALRAAGRGPERLARASFRDFHWTPAQLVAHLTSNGCNLLPGDLLGSGTLSGREEREAGCLLELSQRGQQPLTLGNGEQRRWLQDGDEVILRGHCEVEGRVRIGLGECRAHVLPALVAAHG